MNLKTLSTKELTKLINTTNDLELLARLEDEYVNRVTASVSLDDYDFDEEYQ